MKAIVITEFGGPEVLHVADRPKPQPSRAEVLVRVHATAINRADLLQRAGKYPPPPDAPQDIPGMEFAGEVVALGEATQQWQIGDRVFGLAGGGTYAEFLTVHERGVARIPDNLSYKEAAAIPEVFITAYDAMVVQCGLAAGETVLITAVGSGVGTAAVQIARAIGACAFGTARSASKLERAQALGLQQGFLPTDGNYAQAVNQATDKRGVNVIIELVGGAYVAQDLQCAAQCGRIVVVGLTGGTKVDFDLGMLLRKRLTVRGTSLRMRPLEEKLAAIGLLSKNLVPLFANGQLKPIVDKSFPLDQAAQAHSFVEADGNFGKVILEL